MKRNLLYAVFIICMIYGCNKAKTVVSQAGVYELKKQMLSGGGKDTVYKRTQIKIYTESEFMYASMSPDSSVGFGVGSYLPDTGNAIIEHTIFSSRALDSAYNFNVHITHRDSSGYSQKIAAFITSKGVKYDLMEDYDKEPSGDTSVMDGLWKLDKTFWVRGKDTVKQKATQYKIFWSGHFMFIHRYPVDSTGKNFKNGFGYGDFSFKSDTLSEEEQMTSHPQLLHRKFAIVIKFNGKDEYQQVINDSKTNEQTTEIYKRIK